MLRFRFGLRAVFLAMVVIAGAALLLRETIGRLCLESETRATMLTTSTQTLSRNHKIATAIQAFVLPQPHDGKYVTISVPPIACSNLTGPVAHFDFKTGRLVEEGTPDYAPSVPQW